MSATPCGIVTLLTDLDTVDGYVAAIKGAVLSAFPGATLVDITHHILRGDVTEAAFQLAVVWPVFPPGSVHLIVVAPGIGSVPRAVAVEIAGQYFVAPDNGILTLVIANHPPQRVVVLDRIALQRQQASGSFPGRDLYGPIAGMLASGQTPFDALGSAIETDSLFTLPWSPVVDSAERVHAPVVSVDRYGNCRTLITRQQLPDDVSRVLVRCGAVTVRGIHRTYSDVAVGKTLALFGSHGGLEIAVRGGNAAQSWELARGDDVIVTHE